MAGIGPHELIEKARLESIFVPELVATCFLLCVEIRCSGIGNVDDVTLWCNIRNMHVP